MIDTCPYSRNGICCACRVLKIGCEGERYRLCEQYLITEGKKDRLTSATGPGDKGPIGEPGIPVP